MLNIPDWEGRLRLRLDHVGLKVDSLDRSVGFYERILGMVVTTKVSGDFAHLSFGGHRKVISLIERESHSQAAKLSNPGEHGHFALEVESIEGFYEFYQRIKRENIKFKVIDHDVSWTIYVDDPDGNNIELFLWRLAEKSIPDFSAAFETDTKQNHPQNLSGVESVLSSDDDSASIKAWRGATRFLAEETIVQEFQKSSIKV